MTQPPGTTSRATTANRAAAARSGVVTESLPSRRTTNAPIERRLRVRQLRDLSVWARQLLVLARSGMPLADALSAIARQTPPGPWRSVQETVHRRVEEGVPLAEALAAHPRRFDAVTRGLVAAGESSGQVDVMLDRLSVLARQQLRLRRTLGGAMVYPCLLISIAVVVVIVMLCFVLPRFSGLFETLDMPLPPTTKVLMAASEAIRAGWWWQLPVVAALVGAGWYGLAHPSMRRAIESLALRLPYFGGLRRNLATARIARLLGVLIQSRLPVLDALCLTRDAVNSLPFRDLLDNALDAVSRGESLAGALRPGGLVAPSICEAIHHGERSGQLGPVLSDLADFLDEDNETAVRSVSTIVEPLILIVLGVVVAFIAISLFLPLFDLTAMAQGGT